MYIIDDGIKLDAELTMPADGRDKCPIVIIIHGITGNKDEKHLMVDAVRNWIGKMK